MILLAKEVSTLGSSIFKCHITFSRIKVQDSDY